MKKLLLLCLFFLPTVYAGSLLSRLYPTIPPEKMLLLAIKDNNIDGVRNALQEGASANDSYAFMEAVDSGNAKIVQVLVDASVEVDSKKNAFPYHAKGLLRAASKGHAEIVQVLVDAGIDVNTAKLIEEFSLFDSPRNSYRPSGSTALMEASSGGHVEVARYLVAEGADVNKSGKSNGSCSTPLAEASRGGYVELVQYLVEAGAVVNDRVDEETGCVYSYPLAEASRGGYVELVQYLVEAGAVVNDCVDEETGCVYSYPLAEASKRGAVEVARHLVAAGAEFREVANDDSTNVLGEAVHHGNIEMVRFWIGLGFDVNAMGYYGKTPLESIFYEGERLYSGVTILHCLIAAGARVPDSLAGDSLVRKLVKRFEAVSQSFFNEITPQKITSLTQKNVFMDHGYRVIGTTAYLTSERVCKTIKDLMRRGYRVTALCDEKGDNILHKVAWCLSPSNDVSKLLLYYYPGLMFKPNKKGTTPFQLAVGAGPDMMKLFMDGMSAMPDTCKKRLRNLLSGQEYR